MDNEAKLLKEIEEERADNIAFLRDFYRVDRDFTYGLGKLFGTKGGSDENSFLTEAKQLTQLEKELCEYLLQHDNSFKDCFFVGRNLSGIGFNDLSWAKANLHGAILDRAILVNCDFTEATLSNVQAMYTKFTSCLMYRTNLQAAVANHSCFKRADLRNARLSFGSFMGADFRNADLRGADLSHGRFNGACFAGANLDGAKLWGADLFRADLLGVDIKSCVHEEVA